MHCLSTLPANTGVDQGMTKTRLTNFMLRITELANGVTVATRTLVHMRSAAVGLWLGSGSRHQEPATDGYAHLMEHLLFKGTATLDVRALARRFEAMGGQINAQTGRELITLYGVVPGDQASILAGLFVDMLLRPRFDENDLALEREVILSEMAQLAENPEERIDDEAVAAAWAGHPLGRPILGSAAVLRAATAIDARTFLDHTARTKRLWLVGAGAVNHTELTEAALELSERPPYAATAVAAPTFLPGAGSRTLAELAQSHLIWLAPLPGVADAGNAALEVADHILGGGASSRLFQAVREERGLSYGVQSLLEQYSDCGLWSVQTSCDADRQTETATTVEAVLDGFMAEGPRPDELDTARAHLRARLLTEEDDPHACMERLAHDLIYRGEALATQERLARLADVTAPAVQDAMTGAWAQRRRMGLTPKS